MTMTAFALANSAGIAEEFCETARECSWPIPTVVRFGSGSLVWRRTTNLPSLPTQYPDKRTLSRVASSLPNEASATASICMTLRCATHSPSRRVRQLLALSRSSPLALPSRLVRVLCSWQRVRLLAVLPSHNLSALIRKNFPARTCQRRVPFGHRYTYSLQRGLDLFPRQARHRPPNSRGTSEPIAFGTRKQVPRVIIGQSALPRSPSRRAGCDLALRLAPPLRLIISAVRCRRLRLVVGWLHVSLLVIVIVALATEGIRMFGVVPQKEPTYAANRAGEQAGGAPCGACRLH